MKRKKMTEAVQVPAQPAPQPPPRPPTLEDRIASLEEWVSTIIEVVGPSIVVGKLQDRAKARAAALEKLQAEQAAAAAK